MRLRNSFICFLLVLTYFSNIIAQTEIRRCSVKSIIGSVKIRRGAAANWIDARPNMPLKQNDAIRSFIESEAELETSEGTSLKVGENSTVEFVTFFGNSKLQNTKIKILNGTLLLNVTKLINTNSTFELETPTVTAAIQGTIVSFNISSENTQVKVYEGKVIVTPSGSTNGVELKDNQMAIVSKGQKEVEIEKLDEKLIVDSFKKSILTDTVFNIKKANPILRGKISTDSLH
jgi:ferric-dicitrate binding protein FerR (iron transport regulator)